MCKQGSGAGLAGTGEDIPDVRSTRSICWLGAFVKQGNDEDTEAFYSKGNMGSIFGDKGFRQSIGEDKENLQVSSELPKALSVRPEQAEIVTAVASVFKASEEEVLKKREGRQSSNVARQMAFKRFPTKSLYELFGLYAVPTTAGWR